ncbi:MAG: nuclear transport factor 2 family protein [bacterium]
MTTTTTTNVDTVRRIYEAFGQGNVEAILSYLREDVEWISHFDPIVPWAGDFSGKVNVPRFFGAIFENVEVLGFQPREFVSAGDTVVSMGSFSCKSKATGKSATSEWVFIWKFLDGKVSSYTQFHDPSIQAIF